MATDPKSYQRSPLFYVGDKYKLLSDILPHFPTDIETFIEPFLGGGSVALNTPAQRYLLNDANHYIIQLHEFLRDASEDPERFFHENEKIIYDYGLSRSYIEDIVPDELKKAHVKTYYARHNKEAYTQMRSDYNAYPERSIRMLYLLLIYGFNRMIRFNSSGDFNLPVGNVDFNLNTKKALDDYFSRVPQMDMQLSSMDFEEFMDGIEVGPRDFVYVDPPYLITFSEYNKVWNEENEKRLLEMLDRLDAEGRRFAISNVTRYKGRRNPIFEDWSAKYHSHDVKSNYISYHDNTNKVFTEVLVTNYD